MRWLIGCLGMLLLTVSAQADAVEARLIRASNEKATPDAAVQDLTGKLKKVFGYQHYKQLGKEKKELKGTDVVGLNIGEGFTLFCHPKSSTGKKHEMDVEMYSGKTLIVKQEKLAIAEKNVLFIRGPEVGSTVLIVALTVTE
ncbi:MAG: hypothetical protein WCS70_08745 [Verrucomicrobiota bacterium]